MSRGSYSGATRKPRIEPTPPPPDETIIGTMQEGVDPNVYGEWHKEPEKRVQPGPYCVECREDTTGQAGRIQTDRDRVEIQRDAEGNPVAVPIIMAGWTCENCKPFENELIEGMCKSLIERNFDKRVVRRAMRQMGEEAIWEHFFRPTLDTAEVVFGLEYR